jgi:hypothetical protein
MKNNKKYISSFAFLASFAILVVASPVLADNTTNPVSRGNMMGVKAGIMMRGAIKLGVSGKVTAVSGNTITVSGKQGFGANAVATTFTIDATNAKVTKVGATSTVSAIAVGDTIMAQGTLTGTNLVATTIRDGVMPIRNGQGPQTEGDKSGNANSVMITGNGEPIVAGTISAITGSTITITNKSNVTYTVDATNAKVAGNSGVTSVSNLAVGDMVIVQGTVSGNGIVASSVIDQAKSKTDTTSGGSTEKPNKGFFGGIGAFFGHIFGF